VPTLIFAGTIYQKKAEAPYLEDPGAPLAQGIVAAGVMEHIHRALPGGFGRGAFESPPGNDDG